MKKVFNFTLREATKGKSFFITTFGISIFLMLAGIISLGMMAYSQKEETVTKKKEIQKVYVVNETSFDYLDFSEIKNVSMVKEKAEVIRKKVATSSEEDALVRLSMKEDETMGLTLEMPEDSEVEEDTGYEILEKMSDQIQKQRLLHSQISKESLSVVMLPVNTEYTTVGKEPEGIGSMLTKTLGPAAIIMVLYFMIIIYGQSISKAVTAEKTSKLMETMLLSVKPYELLGGKIFAMACVGMSQFLLWLLGVVLGLCAGNYVGILINPSFDNQVLKTIQGIRSIGIGTELSIPAIVLAFVAICISFTFYCVIAGIVASRISKVEDLSQGMAGYQFLVLIGFFGSYFPILQEKETLLSILRWFPLTAAFSLPSDILLGGVSMGMGICMLLVLVLVTIALVFVAGRMYRNKVFYQR